MTRPHTIVRVAFHEQAEWSDRGGWRDIGVERFRSLTVHEQRQLIRAAQYPEVPA